MDNNLPVFTHNQQVGNRSASILKSIMQKFCIFNDVGQEQDLGIDFTGIVLENNKTTYLCFNAQCKGTEDICKKKLLSGNEFTYSIKVSTINYWKQKKDITLLFLVDASNNDVYWLDVLDYIKEIESSQMESVSIRIPECNKINSNMTELPEEFKRAILLYYCNFAEHVKEQLYTVQELIKGNKSVAELSEILYVLQENINKTTVEYKKTILEVLAKIQYNFGKAMYFASQLNQMDDVVRALYCPNGVYNDFKENGFSVKEYIDIVKNLISDTDFNEYEKVKKLFYFLRQIELLRINITYFYREMIYEDCPWLEHSDVEDEIILLKKEGLISDI